MAILLFAAGVESVEARALGDGEYAFEGLTPGQMYTVREMHPAWLRFSSTADEVTVRVKSGENAQVDFRNWDGFGT